MIKRLLQDLIIWLKVDLRLSTHFKTIREKLYHDITARDGIFVNNFRGYFLAPFPYDINPEDPPAILGLKKLLNALAEAEAHCREIELIDIREEVSTYGMIVKAFAHLPNNLTHLHHAIMTIAESAPELQEVLSPYVQPLLQMLPQVQQELQKRVKGIPELATALGAQVAALPTEPASSAETVEQFFHLILDLPKYFEHLNELMGVMPNNAFDEERWQRHADARAKAISEHLQLITHFRDAGIVAHLPHYFHAMEALVKHSADLLGTADHLTQEGYHLAVMKLSLIRQDIAWIISEFEAREERLGVKPEIKAPLMRQLEIYYEKIAKQLNVAAEKSHVLQSINKYTSTLGSPLLYFFGAERTQLRPPIRPDKALEVLQSPEFLQILADNRVLRRARYLESAEDTRVLDAAADFFAGIEALLDVDNRGKKTSHLGEIPPDFKRRFIATYRLIQPYVAKYNPELDTQIVEGLLASPSTVSSAQKVLSFMVLGPKKAFSFVTSTPKKVVNLLVYREQTKSQLQQIREIKAQVMQAIHQERNQARLTLLILDEANRLRRLPSTGETILSFEVAAFVIPEFAIQPPVSYTDYARGEMPLEDRSLTAVLSDNEETRDKYRLLLAKVEEAREQASVFYQLLSAHPARFIQDLPEEVKAPLRKAYQTIQPHMVEMNPEMNRRLVSALSRERQREAPLTLADLPTPAQFDDYFARTLQIIKEKEEGLTRNILTAKKNNEQPLVPLSRERKFSNLFVQLSELKLSSQLATFIQVTLKRHLKKRLSKDVFDALHFDLKGGMLDLDIIPYYELALYADESEPVKLYQSLINTLVHLQKAIRDLETIPNKKSFAEIRALRIFILSFVARAVNSITYFHETTHLPLLEELKEEWKGLLKPFEALPYLQQQLDTVLTAPHRRVNQPFDASAVWKEQMAIVEQALKHEPYVPQEVPVPVVVEPVQRVVSPGPVRDPILVTAEYFFRLPNAIAHLTQENSTHWSEEKIQAKATHLVSSLNHIGLNAASLSTLLESINDLMQRFSQLSAGSRLLLTRDIIGLRYDIYVTILRACDASELKLGLKPGVLSQSVCDSLDVFFDSLCKNLPIGRQEHIALFDRSPIIAARIRHVKDIGDEQGRVIPHINIEEIDAQFLLLETVLNEGLDEDKRTVFLEIYGSLQPLLSIINDDFSQAVFLRKLRTPKDVEGVV